MRVAGLSLNEWLSRGSRSGLNQKAADQCGDLVGSRVQCEMTCIRNVHLGAHPGDKLPAPRGRTRGRAYPRSPADAAASRASMPAISGMHPHWFGNRKTGRFECPPGPADSGMQTRPSKNRGCSDPRSDRCRLGVSASSTRKGDLYGVCFRWRRDRPKRRGFQFAPRPSLCATASWTTRASTHGPAVILHVERIAREIERFGEAIHNLRVTIERIRE